MSKDETPYEINIGSPESGHVNNGYVNVSFEHTDSMELNVSTLGSHRGSTSVLNLPPLQRKSATLRRPSASKVLIMQKYTEPAKKAAKNFSSVNYSPSHSLSYMEWLRSYSKGHMDYEWDRWFLTLLIGILVGLLGVFLNQCLGALGNVKWDRAQVYAQEGRFATSWGYSFGVSIGYVLIGSILVAFIHPPAVAGGTPDVIAYLNGVVVHQAFGLKNLLVKFTSNVFAVSAGMPCAIQGPLITYGAIIGSGVGQFKSDTLKFKPKIFSRFRNAIDRRWFTTAGLAAGVAAGFNAPIGGLMFAMEDVCSYWSKDLSWHVFFCSVVATLVAALFEAALNGFKYVGVFGPFTLSLTEPIATHIAMLCVSIVLGLIGGAFGAIFTLANTQWVGVARKLVFAKAKNPLMMKCMRIFECIIIVLIMSLYYTLLPEAIGCANLASFNTNVSSAVADCLNLDSRNTYANVRSPLKLIPYHCQNNPNDTTNFYYSELATIIQNGGQQQLQILWSRGTHYYFSWYTGLVLFAVWFPMAIWTLGSAVAGGIFVPLLLAGSMYGRSLGVGLTYLYAHLTESGSDIPVDTTWRWIDPGMISVLAAGSILAGVTRLALATTIIVVEMSQDINILIPLMIAIVVSKWTADNICKPLYQFQLDAKSLPYLEQTPVIALDKNVPSSYMANRRQLSITEKTRYYVNLELFKAKDIMSSPVRTIRAVESLFTLSKLLTSTSHCGFPVIKRDLETNKDVCYGLITRNELYAVLCCKDVFDEKSTQIIINPSISYDELSQDYIKDEKGKIERVSSYNKLEHFKNVFVNLDPFINISAPKVDADYSLLRTYNLFRTLGLRHLVIVDIINRPIGMITRVDLMPFNIMDKLNSLTNFDKEPDKTLPRQSSSMSMNSDATAVYLPAKSGKPDAEISTVSKEIEDVNATESGKRSCSGSESSDDKGNVQL